MKKEYLVIDRDEKDLNIIAFIKNNNKYQIHIGETLFYETYLVTGPEKPLSHIITIVLKLSKLKIIDLILKWTRKTQFMKKKKRKCFFRFCKNILKC